MDDRKRGAVPGVGFAGLYLKTPSSFLFAPSTVGAIQILASHLVVQSKCPRLGQNHRHLDCMLEFRLRMTEGVV